MSMSQQQSPPQHHHPHRSLTLKSHSVCHHQLPHDPLRRHLPPSLVSDLLPRSASLPVLLRAVPLEAAAVRAAPTASPTLLNRGSRRIQSLGRSLRPQSRLQRVERPDRSTCRPAATTMPPLQRHRTRDRNLGSLQSRVASTAPEVLRSAAVSRASTKTGKVWMRGI